MRIIMLTDRFPPEVRASAHLYHELAAGLVGRGHEVGVVTRMPADYIPSGEHTLSTSKQKTRYWMDGIEVILVRSLSALHRSPAIRAVDQLRVGLTFAAAARHWPSADVVLIYSPPLPLAIAGCLYRRWVGTPFILSLHDLYPQTAVELGLLRNRILIRVAEWLEKMVYRHAARIIVPATGSRDVLINRKAINAEKICLIPNWVDTNRALPGPKENGFRNAHGLSGSFVISYAGVMGFAQDLSSVVECARMLQHVSDIVFLLVGEGVYKAKWEQMAVGLRNVRFLPMQSKDQYFELLRASDVCLVPLTKALNSPAIPGKIQSIMAVARPVVAIVNPMGDAAELIVRSQSGFVVPPEQADELVQVILQLHGDREMGEKYGANGRTYVERHFSLEGAIAAYEETCEAVVRDKRGLFE